MLVSLMEVLKCNSKENQHVRLFFKCTHSSSWLRATPYSEVSHDNRGHRIDGVAGVLHGKQPETRGYKTLFVQLAGVLPPASCRDKMDTSHSGGPELPTGGRPSGPGQASTI